MVPVETTYCAALPGPHHRLPRKRRHAVARLAAETHHVHISGHHNIAEQLDLWM